MTWFYAAKDAGTHQHVALLLSFIRSGHPNAVKGACQVLQTLSLTGRTLPAFREMLYSTDPDVQYHGMKAFRDCVNVAGISGLTKLPGCPDYETFKKNTFIYVGEFKSWLLENEAELTRYTQMQVK